MPIQIDWLDILGKVAELVLVPLISTVVLYFISWLGAKKRELQEKVKDDRVQKYLNILETTIIDCVIATNQTYVEALKKDDIFTEDAKEEAFKRTYDTVMTIISDEAKECLGTVINDLETYIKAKIETQVSLNKH